MSVSKELVDYIEDCMKLNGHTISNRMVDEYSIQWYCTSGASAGVVYHLTLSCGEYSICMVPYLILGGKTRYIKQKAKSGQEIDIKCWITREIRSMHRRLCVFTQFDTDIIDTFTGLDITSEYKGSRVKETGSFLMKTWCLYDEIYGRPLSQTIDLKITEKKLILKASVNNDVFVKLSESSSIDTLLSSCISYIEMNQKRYFPSIDYYYDIINGKHEYGDNVCAFPIASTSFRKVSHK